MSAPPAAQVPPAAAVAIALNPLRLADPFRWLRKGLQDVVAAPGIALFYGACFWCMALVLGWVFRTRPEYTMSLASGCLLLGPFLAMGLYDTSRRRQVGLAPELGSSLTCWDRHLGSMGLLRATANCRHGCCGCASCPSTTSCTCATRTAATRAAAWTMTASTSTRNFCCKAG